jgi:hypothetical protein
MPDDGKHVQIEETDIQYVGRALSRFTGTNRPVSWLDVGTSVELTSSGMPLPLAAGTISFTNERELELRAKVQAKEAELAKVKEEYLNDLQKRDRDNDKLKAQFDEIEKQARWRHILDAVELRAKEKLVADESFAQAFEAPDSEAYVMSVDIRKSTDLMLNANKPERVRGLPSEAVLRAPPGRSR